MPSMGSRQSWQEGITAVPPANSKAGGKGWKTNKGQPCGFLLSLQGMFYLYQTALIYYQVYKIFFAPTFRTRLCVCVCVCVCVLYSHVSGISLCEGMG